MTSAILITQQAQAATTTCATVAACVFGNNKAAGFGIEGASEKGDGVVGYTYLNSTSASTGKSGVSGYDASTNKSTANSGVYGTSPYGYGVHAKSASGTALYAESVDGVGIYGLSENGIGVQAYSSYSTAVSAISNFDAIAGLSYENCCFQTATGISAFRSGPGASIAATAYANVDEDAYPDLFDGLNDTATVASIDYYGNLRLAGSVTATGTPMMITKLSDQQHVGAFAPRVTSPTIEDTGMSRLTNGRAYVSLDTTFAKTIDPHEDYLVFVTPRGDSNGLYVARTSLAGFEVRENRNGTSTLAFDYRIVAKPYDSKSIRLPALNPTLDTAATNAYRLRMRKALRASTALLHH